MARVWSGIIPGSGAGRLRAAAASGVPLAPVRYARLAVLAFVLGAGTAAATTTPSVQTTRERHDAGAVVDQRINSECSGLAGAQRHECVFDVLARDRKRSGTAAN